MTDATTPRPGEPAVLDRWSARRVQPIVVLYVVAVFAACAAAAHFVVHSAEAVKALAIAALGAVAATVPGVMGRVEYRLTESGLEKRMAGKRPDRFQELFSWRELRRVIPMRHGFKYVTAGNEASPLRSFWRRHVSGACSGEVLVERADLERVLGFVRRRWIPAG